MASNKQERSKEERSETPAPRPSTLGMWSGSPFTFLRRFSEEMDRLFGDFPSTSAGGALIPQSEFAAGMWAPRIDLVRKDNEMIVRADLPGVNKDDLKVAIEGDYLVIQGQRKEEKEEKKEESYKSERIYGSFYRRIQLPDNTESDKINAKYQDGVLEIKIPVPPEQSRAKQIAIQ